MQKNKLNSFIYSTSSLCAYLILDHYPAVSSRRLGSFLLSSFLLLFLEPFLPDINGQELFQYSQVQFLNMSILKKEENAKVLQIYTILDFYYLFLPIQVCSWMQSLERGVRKNLQLKSPSQLLKSLGTFSDHLCSRSQHNLLFSCISQNRLLNTLYTQEIYIVYNRIALKFIRIFDSDSSQHGKLNELIYS